MNFIQFQVMIFLSIIIFSLFWGKKASLIISIIWIVETYITYKIGKTNYLQVITVSLSFQIGMLTAIIRDFIVKKFKNINNRELG